MLSRLRCEVARLWRKCLLRRNRGNSPNWERFQGMLRVFPLFPARTIHSSMQRNHNPEGPDAFISLVRISGGRPYPGCKQGLFQRNPARIFRIRWW